MSRQVARVLPDVEGAAGFFWTSGRDGTLRILRCESCAYLIHPPSGYCPRCQSRQVRPAAVSGRGSVYSFTVNFQPWDGADEAYVIALVQLAEQSDVRLVTNIVGVDPPEVFIDMPVRVVFENHDPVYLPLFEPASP